MNVPTYILQRWPYGYVICGIGRPSLSLSALVEATKLVSRSPVSDKGICRHLRVTVKVPNAVATAMTVDDSVKWRAEIAKELTAVADPQARWWLGFDVGTSSAAMFAVLSTRHFVQDAKDFGRASTPLNAANFGKCSRLLAAMPEWRSRLGEVAAAYPAGAWPRIIARWAELEAATATPVQQTAILVECDKEARP